MQDALRETTRSKVWDMFKVSDFWTPRGTDLSARPGNMEYKWNELDRIASPLYFAAKLLNTPNLTFFKIWKNFVFELWDDQSTRKTAPCVHCVLVVLRLWFRPTSYITHYTLHITLHRHPFQSTAHPAGWWSATPAFILLPLYSWLHFFPCLWLDPSLPLHDL